MTAELFHLAGMESALNRRSKKWLSISTLYYTKGTTSDYIGRSKPLYFSQFLELLPGLAKCMFCENMPRNMNPQAVELEQEQATKNLLILF